MGEKRNGDMHNALKNIEVYEKHLCTTYIARMKGERRRKSPEHSNLHSGIISAHRSHKSDSHLQQLRRPFRLFGSSHCFSFGVVRCQHFFRHLLHVERDR